MTSKTLLLSLNFVVVKDAPILYLCSMTTLAGDGEKRLGNTFVIRHVMKCKRGHNCPIIICREIQDEDARKERVIQAFTSSPFYLHYFKCREGLRGPSGPMYNNCPLCEAIRADMKWLKEKYFNESPMSLQLLAACAVPKDQIMNLHPHIPY